MPQVYYRAILVNLRQSQPDSMSDKGLDYILAVDPGLWVVIMRLKYCPTVTNPGNNFPDYSDPLSVFRSLFH